MLKKDLKISPKVNKFILKDTVCPPYTVKMTYRHMKANKSMKQQLKNHGNCKLR